MTVHDRQLDRLRLGELDAEEAAELLRQLQEDGEMGRLDDLIVDAEAFLEHYPAGPAVEQISAKVRRVHRRSEEGEDKKKRGFGAGAFVSVGAGLSCMLFLFLLMPGPQKIGVERSVDIADADVAFIQWHESDFDCVGTEACRAAALEAYEVGKRLSERQTDDPAVPYEAYKQFERAQLLLTQGGVSSLPDSMQDMPPRQAALKAELDTTFRQASLNFRNFHTRKMYREMARELEELQTRFPDKRSLYNQWAVEQERKMRDDAVYPTSRD